MDENSPTVSCIEGVCTPYRLLKQYESNWPFGILKK